MCGIAALIGGSQAVDLEALRAMTSVVTHRGPDDEGYVVFQGASLTPEVFGGPDTPQACRASRHAYLPSEGSALVAGRYAAGLGHRRLSIIDLSPAGHQPMCLSDRGAWIVYNGEIYNYVELRAELQALGHVFTSESDTEVILAAYARWGTACLQRFEGMFAFVIIDRAGKQLFAARDRFGIKPLYYRIADDGTLAFASEIKQFAVLLGWRAAVNGQRAYDFLSWGVVDHTDETLFSGVFQLRNGQFVRLAFDALPELQGGTRLPATTWYDPDVTPYSGTLDQAAVEFRRLMEESVRVHLRADVPVGSCLSGGLDSSTVVCLMSRELSRAGTHGLQRTFSACSHVPRFDERQYIEEVVRDTRVAPSFTYPQVDELFALLDRIAWHQDEPFGSSSIFAQWQVFALAQAAGVKVMLDGQGADEQLAGYGEFFGVNFAQLLRSLRWCSLVVELQQAKRLHGVGLGAAAKQVMDVMLPDALRLPLRRLAGKSSDRPAWIDVAALGAAPGDPLVASGQRHARSVNALSRAQLFHSNLQMLLHWEDRDSMAHSVEARVPFLDHRIVEFALSLPPEYKLHAGMTKRVMREAMRGVLPERIRARTDKLAFVTPEEVWAREQAPQAFVAGVRNAVEASAGILTARALELAQDITAGRAPFSFALWRMVSFGAWMRRFGVGLA
jgi:asparagine synthase (glutamine-hydrolysing)